MIRLILAFLLASLSFSLLRGQSLPTTVNQSQQTSLQDSTVNYVWKVPQKNIPIPSAASQELQTALKDGNAPNLEQTKLFRIQSEQAWIGFQQAADAGMSQVVEQLKIQFPVTITEEKIVGVSISHITPSIVAKENKNNIFIHLHGGAYVIGAQKAGLWEAIILAERAQIEVISIDYRMPPNAPFPAAIDDVVVVYKNLVQKYSSKNIAIGGTSAGGGLALSTIHKLKMLNLDLPGAIFAGTPWSDLTKTGDTQFTNEGIDHVLVSYDSWLKDAAEIYVGANDFKNPLISPIYGDFVNFPPTYIVTGTRDLFLSDAARTHRKLKLAGAHAELNVYEGVSHADFMISFNTPESVQVYKELGEFLKTHLK